MKLRGLIHSNVLPSMDNSITRYNKGKGALRTFAQLGGREWMESLVGQSGYEILNWQRGDHGWIFGLLIWRIRLYVGFKEALANSRSIFFSEELGKTVLFVAQRWWVKFEHLTLELLFSPLILEIELRVSRLQGKHSPTWAMPPVLLLLVYFSETVLCFCLGLTSDQALLTFTSWVVSCIWISVHNVLGSDQLESKGWQLQHTSVFTVLLLRTKELNFLVPFLQG
jgi:hypothetical protein